MTLFAVFQANFFAKYGQSSPQRGTFYGQIDIKNNFSRTFFAQKFVSSKNGITFAVAIRGISSSGRAQHWQC